MLGSQSLNGGMKVAEQEQPREDDGGQRDLGLPRCPSSLSGNPEPGRSQSPAVLKKNPLPRVEVPPCEGEFLQMIHKMDEEVFCFEVYDGYLVFYQ